MDADDRAPTHIGTIVETFVDRWRQSAASERANYGLFLIELCEVLGLSRPEQFKAVRDALAAEGAPAEAGQVAAHFVRARRARVAEVLETLVSLGQARQAGPSRFTAS